MARPPGTVTLCPIGPLTNVALAIIKEPAIVPRLKEIVLMGGSMELGNVTASAEFNIYVDPHAARVVFECGAPIVMLGLDVTHKALVTDERLARIKAIGTPVAQACAGLLDFFNRYDKERYHIPGRTAARPVRDRLPAAAGPVQGPAAPGRGRDRGHPHLGPDRGRLVAAQPAPAQCPGDQRPRRRGLLRSAQRAAGPAVTTNLGGNPMTRIMHAAGAAALAAALLSAPIAARAQDAAADPAKIEALETAVRTLTTESGTLRGELEALRAQLAERDNAAAEAGKVLAARDAKIAALTADLAAATADVAAKTEAQHTLTEQAESVAASAAALEVRLAEAEAALAERNAVLERQRAELLAARNDLGSAEARLVGKDKEFAALATISRELVVAGEEASKLLAERDAQLGELRGQLLAARNDLGFGRGAARRARTRRSRPWRPPAASWWSLARRRASCWPSATR